MRPRRALAGALAALAALGVCAALLIAAPAAAQHLAGDEEVPFITTPDRVTLAMLQLAGVGPTDHVIDLGSGDGRIVITAALRFGASGLGVDLVPDLVARSQHNAQRAGVSARTRFMVQDLFDTELSAASVITLYLLPEVNLKLRPRLLALAPGTRIVSHDWDMGDWRPDRSMVLEVPEKTIGRDKRSTLHLWVVPARLQGLWCGDGGLSLQIDQRFQAVQALLQVGDGAPQPLAGQVEGPLLRLHSAAAGGTAQASAGPGGWTARADGKGLHLTGPSPVNAPAGARLQASTGSTCR